MSHFSFHYQPSEERGHYQGSVLQWYFQVHPTLSFETIFLHICQRVSLALQNTMKHSELISEFYFLKSLHFD